MNDQLAKAIDSLATAVSILAETSPQGERVQELADNAMALLCDPDEPAEGEAHQISERGER